MSNEQTSFWTAEKIGQLRELWLAGHSTRQIGQMIQTTKNSVIGKVHRLDLPARPSPIRRSSDPTQAPASPKASGPKPVVVQPPIEIQAVAVALPAAPTAQIPVAAALSILPARSPEPLRERSRSNISCQWPTGQPGQPDFRFCGEPVQSGKPYCMAHCCRAFMPSRKEETDRRSDQAV